QRLPDAGEEVEAPVRALRRDGLAGAQRNAGIPASSRTDRRGADRGVGSGAGPRPPGDRTAAAGAQKGGLDPREKWQVIQASRMAGDPVGALPLEVACAVLGVNRGSYYRHDPAAIQL